MQVPRRRFLGILATASALSTGLRAAEAGWPSRPLRIVVPGGPGSVTDGRARWLAERLAPALGQPVVVDNRPGAGGNIATAEGGRSAPDGYTIVLVHQGTMAINPHLYARTGYDPLADFEPLTRFGIGALLLAVPAQSPAHSIADLAKMAKAKPGGTRFCSPGVGTPPHMAAELFVRMAGFDATHVPYRGGAQAVADLIAGHVDWSIDGMAVLLPQVKSGRLRALAVTTAQRAAAAPDVPTLAEAGVPGYEYIGWVGFALPARTPRPIVARLYAEVAKIVGSAEAREYAASLGGEPGLLAPEEFAAFIREEHAKWGKLIRDASIRLE